MTNETTKLTGGCACKAIRYRLESNPLFVHCCHCTWCQRETGSAFVLNALIETDRVSLIAGEPVAVHTPSNSGKGQVIWRCRDCSVALWSHYAGAGEKVCFVRVGTLDEADRVPPDIHIFTSSKQPWVVIPPGHRSVEEFYDLKEFWSEESLARRKQLLAANS